MESPINEAELCQFIHCCKWMSNSIPDLHRRIQPLTDILEKAYKETVKRKKSALKNILLRNLSCGTKHNAALMFIQYSLRQVVQLTFPKESLVIYVYTDASEEFWTVVITQTSTDQLTKSIESQKHELMAILGVRFGGAQ